MQKGGFAPLKRFLCAVIVAALLLFCVACGSHAAVSADSIATAAPTASSSRNIRSEPITVNSTVADADTVNNAQTAAPTTEVTIGRALSCLSGAATLDTGILGSECAGAQDAGGQRNEHCAKNSFPNSLFHGKVLSVMYDILPVTFSVRNHHRRNHPNQSRLN